MFCDCIKKHNHIAQIQFDFVENIASIYIDCIDKMYNANICFDECDEKMIVTIYQMNVDDDKLQCKIIHFETMQNDCVEMFNTMIKNCMQ